MIGLIGGMSWESTVTYYQVINETIKQKLGGFHSAKILMYRVDFDEIETNMSSGNWAKNAAILSDAAKRLETAGADFILICTNTLHKVAPEVREQLSVPLLHIAEVTARELKKAGIESVGLLGTRFTMTEKFYTDVLKQSGIRVLIPEEEDAQITDRIIFDELCIGDIRDSSRQKLIGIMESLRKKGAQGIVLGCTELGLLVSPKDTIIPLFDTTLIHAKAAALEASKGNALKTERLIINHLKETDKEAYFQNISHDRKVLETFICKYAENLEEFDFSSYPGRQDLFAIRLKETGGLIGIILYFDEKEGSCEIG